MNNREWLESLTNEQLSIELNENAPCDYCAYLDSPMDNCSTFNKCTEGIAIWLGQEKE